MVVKMPQLKNYKLVPYNGKKQTFAKVTQSGNYRFERVTKRNTEPTPMEE